MKYFLIILLFFSLSAHSQIISFIWHGDTLWAKNPGTGDSTQISNKVVPWGSVASKPSTYAVATHNHIKADITDFGSYTNISDTSAMLANYKAAMIANTAGLLLKANLSTTPQIVASINLTAQTANIGTTTLYAVPSAGFYRVSIYITVTSAGTTSTMPSTTITYTDGNAGTNSHSTTTTATSSGNSVTTTFAQTTYVLYAKASTNIQYATGSYASTGSAMQYALRIRVEAL